MTKNEKIKFAYLVCYIVSVIITTIMFALFKQTEGGIAFLIIDGIIIVLGGIGFVILHNRITKYHCHHCNKEFKLNVLDTVIGEDKGTYLGKKSTCPNCNQKDYYKVVR